MTLPLALAQRLQKRGIISKTTQKSSDFEQEEVIAEDYDDFNKAIDSKSRVVVNVCPNKYNIYHDCSHYCQKRWSNVSEETSPKTKRKYQKLLKRFPLPDNWQEVYDPGVRCYYFWNTITDEVSWLPPHHPNARISLSAQKLRTLLRDEDEEGSDASNSDNLISDNSSDSYESDSDSSAEKNKKSSKSRPLRKNERTKGRNIRNNLDPMDPASYSDIPIGKWSDGLDKRGDAKTGVDTTASGSLFQMRPYPNPGAILRMNAKKRGNESSDDD